MRSEGGRDKRVGSEGGRDKREKGVGEKVRVRVGGRRGWVRR